MYKICISSIHKFKKRIEGSFMFTQFTHDILERTNKIMQKTKII